MSGPDNQEVAQACIHLFERWTREEKIPKEEFPALRADDFLAWIRNSTPPLNAFEIIAQMEGKCSMPSIELLFEVANEENGAQRIMSMWPFMIMSARGNKHKVRSFQFLTVLTFDDDVVAPLSIFAHQDVIEGVIDDAAVITFMQDKVPGQTQRILMEGLDTIHDTYEPDKLSPIEDTLKQISDLLDHFQGNVPEDDYDQMQRTLTFLGSMFPKVVPDEMKQQLKEIGKRQAASEGGWDVPG